MNRLSKYKEELIYFVFVVLMVLTMINKQNFHVDEMFSYGLANNRFGMSFEDGHTYMPIEEVFVQNFKYVIEYL